MMYLHEEHPLCEIIGGVDKSISGGDLLYVESISGNYVMHIYISVSVVIKTYSTHPVSVTHSARPGYGRSSRNLSYKI